ncbi:MAG: DUF2802 domain-containing protein [Pseudomonadota bacterium]
MTVLEIAILAFTFLMMLGCIGVLLKMHLSWKQVYQRENQRNQMLEQCLSELQILSSSHLGVGKRVEKLSKELFALREQVELDEHKLTTDIPYEQLAKLAEQGTDANGLVDLFGVSQAEADLVVKLHAERSVEDKIERRSSATSH